MSDIQKSKFQSRLTNGLQTSLKYVKTLFGKINDENVTFCIDASGSMYQFYDYIREHLIEVLIQLSSDKRHKFNVILFNSSVHQFSKNPLQCNIENIRLLIEWMKNDNVYESKSDLLGGLIKSFETNPDSVYLVSDGYPDQDRKVIFSNLLHICRGRPIQCILITDTIPVDEYSTELMERIAQISHGSFTIIQHSKHGNVDVIQPLFQASVPNTHIRHLHMNYHMRNCSDKSEKSDLNGINYGIGLKNDPMLDPPLVVPFKTRDPVSGQMCPFYHPYNHWYWPQYWQNKGPAPFCVWSECDDQYRCMSQDFRKTRAFIGAKAQTDQFCESACNYPTSFTLMMNRVILCVSERHAGKLLQGTIIGQGRSDQFKIQFDCDREFNETCSVKISDVVDLDEIKRQRIDCGNWVVVPLDVLPSLDKEKDGSVLVGECAIARVVEGKELRAELSNAIDVQSKELIIQLQGSNDKIPIPTNKAAVISEFLKQRFEKKSEFIRTKSQDSTEDSSTKDMQDDNEDEVDDRARNTNTGNQDSSFYRGNESETVSNCCCIKHCHSSMTHGHHPVVTATPVAPVTKDDEGMSLDELERKIEELKRCESKESMKGEDKAESDDEDDNDYTKTEEEEEDELMVSRRRCSNNSGVDLLSSSTYQISEPGQYTTKISQFTETDVNWALLRIMSKQENERLRSRKQALQNPPWRYWAKDKIPDVIDPPSTEPYKDPEHLGCIMPKQGPDIQQQKPVSFEWPNIKTDRIEPHTTINSISPDRMFKMIRQSRPLTAHHYTMSHDHKSPFQPTKFDLKYNSTNHSSMIYPVQSKYSSNSALNYNPNSMLVTSYTDLARPKCVSRSLERNRIEAQVVRDEENIRNYARQKLAYPTKSVTIVQT